MNPPLHLRLCAVLFVLASLCSISRAEEDIVLYNNLDLEAPGDIWLTPGPDTDPWQSAAQQFNTGDANAVCSVSMTLRRRGTPGGQLLFEVWDVDEDTGEPGESVGTLGQLTINDLPTSDEVITVDGLVEGLLPDTHYFLVFRSPGAKITNSDTYHWRWINNDDGLENTFEEGSLKDIMGISFGNWVRIAQFFDDPFVYSHMQIVGGKSADESQTPLYSNLPDPLPNFEGVFPHAGDRYAAQPFRTGETGSISKVRLSLYRRGSPTGDVHFEIWNQGEQVPDARVASVGTIELESLSEARGNTVTFETEIRGLIPNTLYYLVWDNVDAQVVDANRSYHVQTSTTDEGTNGAGRLLVTVGNEWRPLGSLLPGRNYQRMEIFETTVPSTVDFSTGFDGGSIVFNPAKSTHSVGSEVTVTAIAKEGYTFEKWIYSDQEITVNPLTITVKEGLSLTPIFSLNLNIDIAGAVAVTWNSEADKSYQIHRSSDKETWEVAIDAIQGTGERMMQAFVREETEVFYRVEAIE